MSDDTLICTYSDQTVGSHHCLEYVLIHYRRRLPDVVIIGVKKSGTMTLGRTEDILFFTSILFCHPDTFLTYHPKIVVQGENWFFSSDDEYRKGFPYFISTMPRARFGQYYLL